MGIKEDIKFLENQKKSIDERIAYVKSQCKYENTYDRSYIDYDRNCYSVECTDCGKVLYDGNYTHYLKFKHNRL